MIQSEIKLTSIPLKVRWKYFDNLDCISTYLCRYHNILVDKTKTNRLVCSLKLDDEDILTTSERVKTILRTKSSEEIPEIIELLSKYRIIVEESDAI